MLNLVIFILLLLPLIPLALLLVPGSNVWRRANLLSLAFILFVEMIWYLLLKWVVSEAPSLFSGIGAPLLNRFYNSAWLPVAYVLVVAAIGYLADRYTAGRVSRSGNKKIMELAEMRAKDMESLGGTSGLFYEPSIGEQNRIDKIES